MPHVPDRHADHDPLSIAAYAAGDATGAALEPRPPSSPRAPTAPPSTTTCARSPRRCPPLPGTRPAARLPAHARAGGRAPPGGLAPAARPARGSPVRLRRAARHRARRPGHRRASSSRAPPASPIAGSGRGRPAAGATPSRRRSAPGAEARSGRRVGAAVVGRCHLAAPASGVAGAGRPPAGRRGAAGAAGTAPRRQPGRAVHGSAGPRRSAKPGDPVAEPRDAGPRRRRPGRRRPRRRCRPRSSRRVRRCSLLAGLGARCALGLRQAAMVRAAG